MNRLHEWTLPTPQQRAAERRNAATSRRRGAMALFHPPTTAQPRKRPTPWLDAKRERKEAPEPPQRETPLWLQGRRAQLDADEAARKARGEQKRAWALEDEPAKPARRKPTEPLNPAWHVVAAVVFWPLLIFTISEANQRKRMIDLERELDQ